MSGDIDGDVLVAREAIAVLGTQGQAPFLAVSISDRAGQCELAKEGKGLANARMLTLNVLRGDASKGAIAPGTYTLSAEDACPTCERVSMIALATDANCESATPKSATSGSITITKVDEEQVEGSFDVSWEKGRTKGSFRALRCELDLQKLAQNTDGAASSCAQ